MRRMVKKAAVRGTATALAVLAFLVLTLTSADSWGFATAILSAAAAIVLQRSAPETDFKIEFSLVIAAIMAGYSGQSEGGLDWALAAIGIGLLGLVVVQPLVGRLASGEIHSANIGLGRGGLPSPRRVGVWIQQSIPVLLVGVAASALLSLPTWPVLVVVGTVTTGYAALVAALVYRRLKQPSPDTAIRKALKRYQPQFVLHFSAPAETEYQVLMWLPYLERIGRPFFIMLREPHSLAKIAAATRAPVVVCPTLSNVDAAMVPSIRAVFYVNHASKVAHTVRFAHLTHIQLHHGDSDKAPSASPVSAMFTKNFVAGQAAIDRYARNGVDIPRDKFVIVGRPQVESIKQASQRISTKAEKVVLYTPTWTGYYSDTNYSSLSVAQPLIEQLLERGVTVILRAHPYTSKNRASVRHLAKLEELLAADHAKTGRKHIWGRRAAKELSVADCINASDALISDVSSVISDYLFSGKPYAVTDVINAGDNVVEQFPLARAGYVLRSDMSNVDKVLELLLNDDPLEDVRREMRTHYLGDFPAENYADVFLEAARRYL